MTLLYLPRYFKHLLQYRRIDDAQRVSVFDLQPCLGDWSRYTPFDAHYFYQGAWLARQLSQIKPSRHVDVGSSVLTLSVASAFVNTVFVDYRPLKAPLPGLTSVAGDITNLPFSDGTLESLSCMHVIEHIGLGRYGDALDPQGSLKASVELQRVIRQGGRLFFSTPIGRERVCFNAHRVYSVETVIRMFEHMELDSFSYIDDSGCMVGPAMPATQSGMEYGCGLFVFKKP